MRITVALPDTHFERPSAEELRRLRKIVVSAHGWLADHDEESFGRAFVAVGYHFRTPAPDKSRYFHAIVDEANRLLDEVLGLTKIDGIAFMAAILAHADVPWQEANSRLGALLEIGLCPTHGIRLARPNRWRALVFP
jgi:hypothetical protein